MSQSVESQIQDVCQVVIPLCQKVIRKNARVIRKVKPKLQDTSHRMNAWICYLKTCAVQTPLTLLECAKDELRRDQTYYPNKEYWQRQARLGCPEGEK